MDGLRSAVELVGAALLTGAAAFHVYWGLGGRTGMGVAIPEVPGKPIYRPSRAACLAVALALVAALMVLAVRTLALAAAPARSIAGWTLAASWVLALVFAARTVGDFRFVGLFKRLRGTRFAAYDDWFYTPLCAVVAAALAAGALPPAVRCSAPLWVRALWDRRARDSTMRSGR